MRKLIFELEQSHDLLRKHKAVESQQEKLAALGQIASGLAHELSNALQPTIGLGGYIKESLRDQGKVRHSAFMDVMIDSAKHAQSVIDNVLAFAQSKPLVLMRHSAKESLEHAMQFAAERLPSSLRIEMEGLDTLQDANGQPLAIECNQTAMSQIFLNILKNGSLAMNHEGTINVCFAPRGASHSHLATDIVIDITDHGCGMDEDTASKIFDPFFTTKAASEGTGLGLAVVYGLVQQHKGQISVESAPGKGATFTIVLPTATQEV